MALQTKALVSSRWLAQAVQLQGSNVRVLDASWFLPKAARSARSEFRTRRIAGASFFDLDRCCDRTSPLEHMLPPERVFADYVGSLGVGRDTHVVVYDASEAGAFSAPRAWWMFRAFGHGAVSLLDGGLAGWQRDGRPVSDRSARPAPAEFTASLNRSWVKTYEDVLDNLDTKSFQLLDARPAGRFRGLDPEPRDNTEPGHIPGSINVPFHHFLSPAGHFLPTEQLQALFDRAGVDLGRPVCVSCGSAVTACAAALAAHQCGHQGVSVYDGGWSEWFTRAAPELVLSEGRGKHV